jgi:hypothetical protein
MLSRLNLVELGIIYQVVVYSILDFENSIRSQRLQIIRYKLRPAERNGSGIKVR